MRARRVGRLLLAMALAGACASARRCGADGLPPWVDELTLNGLMSGSYSYNFNRPVSATNQYRVFDFDDNTFKLDVFELVAQKAVAKPHDSGFRVDLALGSSIPRVSAAAGLFRNTIIGADDIDLQQAYACWIAPLGSGLRLDFGKYVTHFGYEVIEGYDGWNDNATRSLLFGYAIPFTHLGARATYVFSERVTASGMVVNGWDVARDNNRSKSIGAQLALTLTPTLTVFLNGMRGPEKSLNDRDQRTLLDAVVIVKAGNRWTLVANADRGSEQGGLVTGENAVWSGIASYVRFSVTPTFAVTLRGESFDDSGIRTGIDQTLREVTLTPELRLTPSLLIRADARIDHSNRAVFEKDLGFARSQSTILFDAIYSF
jgi:putative OmpL-like beta-barrel porin-2